MSHAVIREFLGVTADDFDRLQAEVGDDAPEGLIVHVAGPTARGWQTIDVFETRAAFECYERDRLRPALARAGVEGEPRTSEVPVHHLLTSDEGAAR